ncbi:uncharacterized protein LOC110683356 [Chenopodium quinoa]|uniref:uncharacterized protein LOC110683356 n=1 Tax=Chenopodium quinoa TaxID=63459 RepID=UPI000B77D28B|nr:uncharacterized protein LOC110683356 [Chenopodium quinoa]
MKGESLGKIFSQRAKEGESAPYLGSYESYTPLTLPRTKIYSVMKGEQSYRKPRPLPQWYQQKNKNLWCEFLESPRHNTDECIQLKDQIEDMVRKGYLKNNIADHCEKKGLRSLRKTLGKSWTSPGIATIRLRRKNLPNTCYFRRDISRRERKRHLMALTHQVNNADVQPPQLPTPNMTFSAADCQGVTFPHKDHLVIVATIANHDVSRTLVDGVSGANILFLEG